MEKTSFKAFCAIFRNNIKNTDTIYGTSKCGHAFHGDCIHQWFKKEGFFCPLCCNMNNKYTLYRLILNPSNENKTEKKESFYWMKLEEPVAEQEIKNYGLQLGLDKDDDPVYAARFEYNYELFPAYYAPKLKGIVFAGTSAESQFVSENIEILRIEKDDADFSWVTAAEGAIPKNAFIAGFNACIRPLYFARRLYENRMCYGCLRLTYDGAFIINKETEDLVTEYEVLIRIPRSEKEKIKCL